LVDERKTAAGEPERLANERKGTAEQLEVERASVPRRLASGGATIASRARCYIASRS
jgi:hypothetical protein